MASKACLFNKCCGPPKWKHYGVATKEAVTYSKLLGQKRGFQEFIDFNNMQISKSGKVDSYCIIDKRCSLTQENNIDIFVFDEEEYHRALYLEYSMHKQYSIKNCKDLLTFLNFNKNSSFHVNDSFIFVKSSDRFKWVLFFNMLEFLIKNLNMSVLGSQFYFPLFSKYLIRNEMRLLLALENRVKGFSSDFMKTCETSALSLKRGLPFGTSYLVSKFKIPKTNISILSKQVDKKRKIPSPDASESTQKLQLKRKSVDSYTEYDCLPKTKRFNSEKNACQCKTYAWKIFSSVQKTQILNYTSILESKKWMNGSEAMHVPIDCSFQDYQNNSTIHESQSKINQELFSALKTSEKSSQIRDKVNEFNSIGLSFGKTKRNQSKSKQISDFQTLKEMELSSDSSKNVILDGFGNFQLTALDCEKEKCKNEDLYPKETTTDEGQKNIAGPSSENPPKSAFIQIDKHSVTFQTASGKSLKISEAALQAAEKMFEEISSENLDIFPTKKTKTTLPKSVEGNKQCVGFQTASGKSLHTSKTALEAAEKMLKEIHVEEMDIFPEKRTQTMQNKECYPSLKVCVDDDISKDLAENFFEDIPFDEKEIDCKPTDDSAALSVQKPETTKTTQTHKVRKSLGGRRSLKPYSLKK